MTHPVKRRDFVAMLSAGIALSGLPFRSLLAQNEKAGDRNVGGDQPHRDQPGHPSENENVLPDELKSYALLSLVLGRISDRSVTVSTVSQEAREGYFDMASRPVITPTNPKSSTFPTVRRSRWF